MFQKYRKKFIDNMHQNATGYLMAKIGIAILGSFLLLGCGGGSGSDAPADGGKFIAPGTNASDIDADGDGFFKKDGSSAYDYDIDEKALLDCNDEDPTIHPGAGEIKDDGIDQNCDGEDLVTQIKCKNSFDCDGDGLLDACDLEPYKVSQKPTPDCDIDGDNHVDVSCDLVDKNHDGKFTQAEYDAYGYLCDNCLLYNPSQLDEDENGKGDKCQACPIASQDLDGDCIADDVDTCPLFYNPTQETDNCIDPNEVVFVSGSCNASSLGDGSFEDPFHSLKRAIDEIGSKKKIYVLRDYHCKGETIILDKAIEVQGGWYCTDDNCNDLSDLKKYVPEDSKVVNEDYLPLIQGVKLEPTITLKAAAVLDTLHIIGPDGYAGEPAVAIVNASATVQNSKLVYPDSATCNLSDKCSARAVGIDLKSGTHHAVLKNNDIFAGDFSPTGFESYEMMANVSGVEAKLTTNQGVTIEHNRVHVGASYNTGSGIRLMAAQPLNSTHAHLSRIDGNFIDIRPAGSAYGVSLNGVFPVEVIKNDITILARQYDILQEEKTAMMTSDAVGVFNHLSSYDKVNTIGINLIKVARNAPAYRVAGVHNDYGQLDILANTIIVGSGVLYEAAINIESGQVRIESNALFSDGKTRYALRMHENVPFTWSVKNNIFLSSFKYFCLQFNNGSYPFNELKTSWDYFETTMSKWDSVADNELVDTLKVTASFKPLSSSPLKGAGLSFPGEDFTSDIHGVTRGSPPSAGAIE